MKAAFALIESCNERRFCAFSNNTNFHHVKVCKVRTICATLQAHRADQTHRAINDRRQISQERRARSKLRIQGQIQTPPSARNNDSVDGTREITEAFLGAGVFRIERLPYEGVFDLTAQLLSQQKLAAEIDAAWFIRQDADEILEPPPAFSTLHAAISAVDADGYNAINFDEFVFTPSANESFEGRDYVAEMTRYYFYEPWAPRLIRAWKRTTTAIALAESGGHSADFGGRRLYPSNFVLRHYIVLSAEHAIEKYTSERIYSEHEVK